MHIILGDAKESWSLLICKELKSRRLPYQIISNPFVQPSLFCWRLDNTQSNSQISLDEQAPLQSSEISSLFVQRTFGWIDPNGWQPNDYSYMLSEIQALLLGWIWSLNCPVVNRLPAIMWCRPDLPFLFWQPLLNKCGLPTLETIITNVNDDAKTFGLMHSKNTSNNTSNNVVYGLLTSELRYLITNDIDWNSLEKMQLLSPVCLTHPHGAPIFVCIIGEKVVWGKSSSRIEHFEPALIKFAGLLELDFLEIVLAPVNDEIFVIAVYPMPCFEHFNDDARQIISFQIVQVLTGEVDNCHNKLLFSSQNHLV